MKTTTFLSYTDWNESIGQYCFNARNAGKSIRFAVDPLVLQRAAADGPRQHAFATPASAADDFRTAVTTHINRWDWNIGNIARGSIPRGLAKLALQVLAVFDIAADDEGGTSYWAALWGVLGRAVDKRGVKPDDLDLETHQRNWAELVRWANVLNQGKLGKLPKLDPKSGGRRHVRLPLSHGLLRIEDIQGLSQFFSRIDLVPGEEVAAEDLIADLSFYSDNPSIFRGAHARRVLQDERLLLAAEQIANAALQWDGRNVDLAKSPGPVVRLWLTMHTSEPTRVRGGLIELNAKGASSDIAGIDLFNLLGRGAICPPPTSVLYRPLNERLLVGVHCLLDGRYVESRYTRPGDEVVIARPTNAAGSMFAVELRRIASEERVRVFRDGTDGLPNGWVVYRLRLRETFLKTDIPSALQGRVKISVGPRIRVSGGLKLRGGWMENAGPTISVHGAVASTVIVDGIEYQVSDGCLHPERCPTLNKPGVHEVRLPEAPRERVQFRVVLPRLAKFSSAVVDAGWSWRSPTDWPGRLNVLTDAAHGSVQGPVIEGEWRPVRPAVTYLPAECAAVRLATALRVSAAANDPEARAKLKAANENHPNLLVRQLARAVTPLASAR